MEMAGQKHIPSSFIPPAMGHQTHAQRTAQFGRRLSNGTKADETHTFATQAIHLKTSHASRVIPGTPPPRTWDRLMVSFPYRSHIFRDSKMGMVWVPSMGPAYHFRGSLKILGGPGSNPICHAGGFSSMIQNTLKFSRVSLLGGSSQLVSS